MTCEQTISDVAMIARNAIDKIIQTTKREWIGLTDDEIHKIFCYVEYETPNNWNSNPEGWCKAFAKEVDDQLKEKNYGS